MTRSASRPANPVRRTVRCAIYTRKSTEEGLEQEFNSLDAQRDTGESYVRSQVHEGWELLPDRYDDGGFTGGNMERPALTRLLADIAAGRVDCVLVYKVDRLSRSLLDFARMMETFDKHRVSFVSVTQQLHTTSSMGRLTLNILLSFAQFEREIISERTRDKIAAARRKGKWVGGMPLLGYDIDPSVTRLVVNEQEAVRVRTIFELYLEHQSLLAVIAELDQRGWTNKRWSTRKGVERGGRPFTKTSLHKLLTNVTYVGKLRYKDEIHPGQQAALVDGVVWENVQSVLRRNGRSGGAEVRNKFGALLKGILRCAACGCAMSPSHATRNGTKRYRYYVCCAAQKRGWNNCPSPSIPAAEIERFVVDRIRDLARDPDLIRETVAQVQRQGRTVRVDLASELAGLGRDLVRWNADVAGLVAHVATGDADSPALARLADLQERIRGAERRATEIRKQMHAIDAREVGSDEVATALARFDPLWNSLTPREQCRVVQLLIERVEYDGNRGKVSVTFHPHGLGNLGRRPEQPEVVAC